MTMRRLKTDLIAIALILAIVFSLLVIGYNIGYNKARETEWENNKQVVSYIVDSGDTLWNIAEQYKPAWLDTREYIYEVRQLNNELSSNLQAGDEILIYIYGNATTRG